MKKKYFIELKGKPTKWFWRIVGINGVVIAQSARVYHNKAQCRNVGENFAYSTLLDWREE